MNEDLFSTRQSQTQHFSGSDRKAWKESDNLPDPSVLAQEIVEDFEAAWEQFAGLRTESPERRSVNSGSGVFHDPFTVRPTTGSLPVALGLP